MERLSDLVDPAVSVSHWVVHFRLTRDAAALPDDEPGGSLIEHLRSCGHDVGLGLIRLAEVVVKVRQGVAAGDVEGRERVIGLSPQRLTEHIQVSIESLDVIEAANLVHGESSTKKGLHRPEMRQCSPGQESENAANHTTGLGT